VLLLKCQALLQFLIEELQVSEEGEVRVCDHFSQLEEDNKSNRKNKNNNIINTFIFIVLNILFLQSNTSGMLANVSALNGALAKGAN